MRFVLSSWAKLCWRINLIWIRAEMCAPSLSEAADSRRHIIDAAPPYQQHTHRSSPYTSTISLLAALINKLVEGERKWQVRERLRWTMKQEQQTASALSETGRRRSWCQGGTCIVTVYSDCDLCVCRRRCQSRGKLNFCIFCNEIFYWILLLSNLWHTCKLDFEFRLHFCLCFWDTSA